jgi:hypothetical protein
MKNKIIGIVICVLLIFGTTALAVKPFSRIEKPMKHQLVDRTSNPLLISGGWMKTFGGTGNDGGDSVQQTSDGGYIITGYTESWGNGGSDVWLIKTDANGEKIWDKFFGGTDNEWGVSVQQTTDGGYIILGEEDSTLPVILIKTDDLGNKIWEKYFKDYQNELSEAGSVQQTYDGGYIISVSFGFVPEHGTLIKTDSNGNEIWRKTYDTNSQLTTFFYSVQQTSDGGYIATGSYWYSEGFLTCKTWLVKTDVNGNKEWERYFDNGKYGFCVDQTIDGGYFIVGDAYSESNSFDVFMAKTDSNGNKIWERTLGTSKVDEALFGQQTNDGGYIIVGYRGFDSTGVSGDLWLIKLQSDGSPEWDRTYGGVLSDWGNSVQQTTDDGYIVVGGTHSFGNGGSDVWLIKVANDDGNQLVINLNGGFGVSAKITNTGPSSISNLPWSINVLGGIIPYGSSTSGTILQLAVNDAKTIKSSGLWGIGSIIINIQVGDITKEAIAFLLGPLVLKIKQQ